MIDMHLDTYFNVASSGVVNRLRDPPPAGAGRRLPPDRRGIRAIGETVTLYDYIRSKGFAVIDLSILEQLSYAANVLCVRDGVILTVEGERVMKTVLANLERKAAVDTARYGRLLRHAEEDYRRIRNVGSSSRTRRSSTSMISRPVRCTSRT